MEGPHQALAQAWSNAATAVQQHPLAKQLQGTLKQWQRRAAAGRDSASSRPMRLPPCVVVMPRHAALAAVIPGDSIAEQVLTSGFLNFLQLYNSALIVRLVLTWFPNPPEAIVGPLATVCDPYLNLFRGIIPPLGGTLDFSPILAFVVLNFFTSSAMALPAEVGPDGKMLRPAAAQRQDGWGQWLQPSKYQQMWARRVAGHRAHRAAQQQQQQREGAASEQGPRV